MRVRRLGLQYGVLLVGVAFAGLARASGSDDDGTANEVVELNKKALRAYEKLDLSGAASLLEQALALCETANLADTPAAARTHVHLGVVYVGGLKLRAQGLAELRKAIAIDPKITIAKSLLNPEVQAAFDEARQSPTPAAVGPAPTAQAERAAAAANPSPSPREGRLVIQHPPVTHAIAGRPVPIRVQVPPGLGAATVVLAYRGEDSALFLVRDMAPAKDATGWFEAEIPAEATQGASVSYYIEVRNRREQVFAGSGMPEAPHQVMLAPEVSPEDLPPPEPIAQTEGDGTTDPNAPAGLWLVFALGSGGGYHSGAPEMNPVDANTPSHGIHDSGFAVAQLGQLAPEIGFFPRDRLLISVEARLQYVTGTQDVVVDRKTFHPARLALAGLAKLSWFPRHIEAKLRPFVSLEAGAGQIRHSITTPESANLTGCGAGTTCDDTVMGGLGLAGLGGGAIWMIDQTFAAYAAVNLLAGFPNFMVNGDLNLGIAILR